MSITCYFFLFLFLSESFFQTIRECFTEKERIGNGEEKGANGIQILRCGTMVAC